MWANGALENDVELLIYNFRIEILESWNCGFKAFLLTRLHCRLQLRFVGAQNLRYTGTIKHLGMKPVSNPSQNPIGRGPPRRPRFFDQMRGFGWVVRPRRSPERDGPWRVDRRTADCKNGASDGLEEVERLLALSTLCMWKLVVCGIGNA